MRAMFHLVPLVAIAVLLTACSDHPTQSFASAIDADIAPALSNGAAHRVIEGVFDLAGSDISISCHGGTITDRVALEGMIYDRTSFRFTPTGAVNVLYQTWPRGLRGTSVVTGEAYRVTEQQHGNGADGEHGSAGTWRRRFLMDGTISGLRFTMELRGHLTINGNGEVTVYRDETTTSCDA